MEAWLDLNIVSTPAPYGYLLLCQHYTYILFLPQARHSFKSPKTYRVCLISLFIIHFFYSFPPILYSVLF